MLGVQSGEVHALSQLSQSPTSAILLLSCRGYSIPACLEQVQQDAARVLKLPSRAASQASRLI